MNTYVPETRMKLLHVAERVIFYLCQGGVSAVSTMGITSRMVMLDQTYGMGGDALAHDPKQVSASHSIGSPLGA